MVDRLFGNARSILESSDQLAARRVLDDCSRIRKAADHIISELIGEEDPSMGRAQTAVVALYVRYLKRVGAHLLNILSSIVSPFERIGYRNQGQDLLVPLSCLCLHRSARWPQPKGVVAFGLMCTACATSNPPAAMSPTVTQRDATGITSASAFGGDEPAAVAVPWRAEGFGARAVNGRPRPSASLIRGGPHRGPAALWRRAGCLLRPRVCRNGSNAPICSLRFRLRAPRAATHP